MVDLDREWAESVAGVKLSDEEVAELTREFNEWLDTEAAWIDDYEARL